MVADIVDIAEEMVDRLVTCTAIPDWPADATVRVGRRGRDGPPDDFLQNAAGMDILSAALVEAISATVGDQVQFLPANVLTSKQRRVEGFVVMNILRCVAALDRAEATYSVFEDDYFLERRCGQVSSLMIPVLRKAALRGSDVCRLAEYKEPVFVSERIRDLVVNGGFTGGDFQEVELT